MKTRESGMPPEKFWEKFFDPEATLDRLGIQNILGNGADLACGYGTFAIPVSKRTKGLVYAIDIDKKFLDEARKKIKQSGLKNIELIQRDFIAEGTGLKDACCDYVFLFNLLHAEEKTTILAEAKRILSPGGKVYVTHWIPNPTTPRGPPMDIRPKPEDCQKMLVKAGFTLQEPTISLPPYHFGLISIKL